MASFQDDKGNPLHLTDAHGNPLEVTDEFGNRMYVTGVASSAPAYNQTTTGDISEHPTSTFAGTHPVATGGAGATAGTAATATGQEHHGSLQDHLRRSGSSSSSTSEDDGEGGRRKKSIKEKIKDKFGKHKDEQTPSTATTTGHTTTSTTTTTGTAGVDQPHEKKGFIEKIKEKLPGHHNHP